MKLAPWKIALATIAAIASMILPAQAGNPNCNEVDGDYIVSFPRGVNVGNEMKAAAGRQIETKFTYDTVLNGFAATLTAEQACAFKKRPGALVEIDGIASASAAPLSWGLDRIDEISAPINGLDFNTSTTGSGVYVYVIDTGIRADHQQFQGRVIPGYSAFKKSKTATTLADTNDKNGHGTHVAGTIGGKDFGVAKSVTLVPVQVLGSNGSGTWSGIISGLNWVAKNKQARSVANMSLGGSANSSVDTAVQNLISAGVTVVVAAGNETQDACTKSPARVSSAITVGATYISGSTEGVASYSNFGSCVDIHAPGSSIISAGISSTSSSTTMSGTSMASPHVAGIVARYLGTATNTSVSSATSAVLTSKQSLGSTSLFIACLTGTGECSIN
jgi:subtilisin family serine protease